MNLEPIRQGLHTLMERTVAFIPDFLTAVILLVVGWLISRLLSAGARRVLRRLDLDGLIKKATWDTTTDRIAYAEAPSMVVSRFVFWIVWIVFIALAVDNLGFKITSVPLRTLIEYLPRLLGAVLMLFLGVILGGFLGAAISAALERLHFAQHRLLAGIARGLVVLVTSLSAIEHLGFDITVIAGVITNLTTLAAAALAVAFAIGGGDMARNMLSGFYAREQLSVGDWISLNEGEGELVGIGTVSSRIEETDGTLIVPNRRLVEGAVKKQSTQSTKTRTDPAQQ